MAFRENRISTADFYSRISERVGHAEAGRIVDEERAAQGLPFGCPLCRHCPSCALVLVRYNALEVYEHRCQYTPPVLSAEETVRRGAEGGGQAGGEG